MSAPESQRLQPLALPAYAVATVLVVFPLVDTALALTPLRLGQVDWRFGAIGLGSQALMTPLLGLLLALCTAVVMGNRGVVRVLQVASWTGAILLVLTIVLFLLDALEVRAAVKATAKGAFDKVSVVALAKYVVGVGMLTTFALSCPRLIRRLPTSSGGESPGLVGLSGRGPGGNPRQK